MFHGRIQSTAGGEMFISVLNFLIMNVTTTQDKDNDIELSSDCEL